MNDFKLLAIRPLKDCNPDFLKVLKEDKVYKFYDDYTFKHLNDDEKNDVIEITHTQNSPKDLYYVKPKKRVSPLPINVSAVVGKNGSGKSTLLELLFSALYNLSVEYKILEYNEDAEELHSTPNETKDTIIKYIKDIKVEIYYVINDTILCFKINTGNEVDPSKVFTPISSFEIKPITEKVSKREFDISLLLENREKFVNDFFFYSIAINYSIYSMNSTYMGNWIAYLFHKNDGYQTPLVINPFRKKGNIDIKTENELVKQRLLANLLEPIDGLENDSLRNFAPNKTASKLLIKLNEQKIENYKTKNHLANIINTEDCLAVVFKNYTGIDIRYVEEEPILGQCYFYAINKLIRICTIYDRYKKFIVANEFVHLAELANQIYSDSSHITFKLKQALNLLRHKNIPNFKSITESKPFEINLDDLSKLIKGIKDDEAVKNNVLNTIELIPPSFFDIQIKLSDGTDFEDCSSGEKQKIYSVSSIIYHLINLNSVFKNGRENDDLIEDKESDFFKYKYINIIFDELELYFHPDFQRTFVFDLLNYIEKINCENLNFIEAINLIFLTHSPFILSDIPNTNILRLQDGSPEILLKSEQNTFGANIHDLLKNEFFMSNGFMGEWSKKKINETLAFLHYIKLQKELDKPENSDETKKIFRSEILKLEGEICEFDEKIHFKLISIIGESVLKIKLLETYDALFPRPKKESDIKAEIEKLANTIGYNIEMTKKD